MIRVDGYLKLCDYLSQLRIARLLLAPFRIPVARSLLRGIDQTLLQMCPPDIRMRHEFNRWAEKGLGESMELDHMWVAERTIPKMRLSPKDRILDLGCGEGWTCRLIAERSQARAELKA